jgi:predicted neuraminidase
MTPIASPGGSVARGNRATACEAWRILCAGLAFVLAGPAAAADAPPPRPTLPEVPRGQVNHAPGLVELATGDLLLCWYSGSNEAARDVRILCARSGDHGATWGPAYLAVGPGGRAAGAREANKSLGNVVLHAEADRVWMIHGVIQRWDVPPFGNLCLNWACGRVDARVSLDGGRRWSPAMRIDDQVGALPRAKPLRHPTLGLLLPLYLEGAQQSYVRPVMLHHETAQLGPPLPLPTGGLIQPSLVPQPDGSVRAFFRDVAARAVHTAVLDPGTRSWSAAVPTDLPNPGAPVEAFIGDDGRVVLIHNPSGADRRTLALAASHDGTHFTQGCDLVPAGAQGEVAYPTAIRASDGMWHVAYSAEGKRQIAHITFDAAWLARCLGGRP